MHIAIIGCGQLARMLALAGIPMGFKFSFIADQGKDTDTSCVDGLGVILNWQSGLNGERLFEATGRPDIITVEKEQIDSSLLQSLAANYFLHPNIDAIEQTKNRFKERLLLNKLNIPVAEYSLGKRNSAWSQEDRLPTGT